MDVWLELKATLCLGQSGNSTIKRYFLARFKGKFCHFFLLLNSQSLVLALRNCSFHVITGIDSIEKAGNWSFFYLFRNNLLDFNLARWKLGGGDAYLEETNVDSYET